MTDAEGPGAVPVDRPRLGWSTLAVATLLYAGCVAFATYPAIAHFRTAFPAALPDPAMHLWVMRWYKTCLLEGRWPVLCPELHYPVGVPLGNFSPMHLQALLYIPLSAFIHNDILIYNILWMAGFLLTGVGTFVLAWYLLRHRGCAWFAGLSAMLSGTMILHAHAHLELLYVGGFPLFLVAWMRLVDRPSRGRLASAAAWFVLLTMGAAYFMILSVFPAALYAAWRASAAGRRGAWPWLRDRARWFLGFSALVVPALMLLFSGQLWASWNGHSMAREESQFGWFVAPLWGYVMPTNVHLLGHLLPVDPYEKAGFNPRLIEGVSYLGVVTLLLLYYAASRRVRFARGAFLWAALAMLVVLSLGPYATVGTWRVGLPASWLWKSFPPMRLTRNPARFNMLAAVCAGVLAAAGLRHLLERSRRRWAHAAIVVVASAVALVDLSVRSFPGVPMPELPACYRFVKGLDPHATLIDAPMATSGSPLHVNALSGYWQALHRCRTTGGYSGHDNDDFDHLLFYNSPFSATRLQDPDFVKDPRRVSFGLESGVDFQGYTWLYLTVHDLRYAVLHQGPGSFPEFAIFPEPLKAALVGAKVFEDATAIVYDRERLRRPTEPVSLSTRGWRRINKLSGPETYAVSKAARIAVYNPDPSRALRLTLGATAYRTGRVVRLMDGGRELARWPVGVVGKIQIGRQISPDAFGTFASPPFHLPAGLRDLTLVSDGDDRPAHRRETVAEGDERPYSLLCTRMTLATASPAGDGSPKFAGRPGAVAR